MTPLEQLRSESPTIAKICARYKVAELLVFGSTARGDASQDSDIDLLVTFQSDAAIGLIGFNRLRRELEEGLGRKVDLVPKDGLKPIIRDEVLAEAQLLYAA
jgi:predicted nucleotidyltransferase